MDIDLTTLDFNKCGQSIVTNALGQTAALDRYRLLEVRGPGCADCRPTNVRYRYDNLGRLIEATALAADGTPLVGTDEPTPPWPTTSPCAACVICRTPFRAAASKLLHWSYHKRDDEDAYS